MPDLDLDDDIAGHRRHQHQRQGDLEPHGQRQDRQAGGGEPHAGNALGKGGEEKCAAGDGEQGGVHG